MAQIVLDLPDSFVEKAGALCPGQDLAGVLADRLVKLWSLGKILPEPLSEASLQQLTDNEVLELAELKMESGQNRRLGKLQTKGKGQTLTQLESIELFALLQVYQLGQLRKSEGLAEAVQRGLVESMAA